MPDLYQAFRSGLESPAEGAFAITPSDSISLAIATRAVHVGSAGNLRAIMVTGEDVTFQGLMAGVVYPFRIDRVMATGTTAGGLVGLR
jgi:hypothetical protein